jgi:hypothetical protein
MQFGKSFFLWIGESKIPHQQFQHPHSVMFDKEMYCLMKEKDWWDPVNGKRRCGVNV